VPLDEVRLPRRGVSVNGLYPEDVSYPLHELLILGFEGKPSAELSAWLESLPPPPAAERGVLIGAVGDIMPGRGVESLLLSGEKGLEAVFASTLPVLKSHDILIGNLEGPVSRGGEKRTKTYTFRFRPEVLAPLKKAGFTYLMTANNHCFDYGERAFLDTLLHLSEAGIGTSGAGKNLKEALMPWETEIRGLPVAILSLGAYPLERSLQRQVEAAPRIRNPNPLVREGSPQRVRDMKQKGAFAVVCVHGGVEYAHRPSAEQKEMYRSLIDAGADIVFGSHPHVLQGMEPRGGGLIVYSLGNFVFPGMDGMERATETAVVSVRLYGGTIRYINFTPARIIGTRTEIDSSGTVAKRYSGLTKLLCGD
jgi:poly-gamma-glutamate synthesis protein (capsule biosynthesis protein)